MLNHLFLHCRPGFEKECAAEITELAAGLEIFGYCKTNNHAAFVVFTAHEGQDTARLMAELRFKALIFARQWFACVAVLDELPLTNRLAPILEVCRELPLCKTYVIETVDTNDGKALAGLCKKIDKPLAQALKKKGFLRNKSANRLHIVFLSGSEAYVGWSPLANSAAWPSGIPRLKVPREAPSRATLKLEEAWHHFVPAEEWDHRLAGSMRAVDLGAAPGGWTYQLVRRSMFVDAIDNGPMQPALMESGQVKHHQLDGFAYKPKKRVHWLVCDIADKPIRVANLIARWVANNWCSEAVFNLKLPMKQRYLEVQKCMALIQKILDEAEVVVEMNFKQLYHDREEVTGHIRRLD